MSGSEDLMSFEEWLRFNEERERAHQEHIRRAAQSSAQMEEHWRRVKNEGPLYKLVEAEREVERST